MKKSIFIPLAFLTLILPVAGFTQDNTDPLTTRGHALEQSNAAVKTPNPAGVQSQFSGAITAVSRDEKTITINDAAKVSYRIHIGDTTKMKRGNRDATWDDLKVGVKVDGICSGEAETAHAETLNIQG